MAAALTVPYAVAALVLGVAGLAKLRSPQLAARVTGAPAGLVRIFAVAELALAGWALSSAGLAPSGLMAALYAGFSLLTLRLARAGRACGCFGADPHPASPGQSLLSLALAAVSLAAVPGGAHAVDWIFRAPVGDAAILGLGTAGAVYGVVLAYSELPLLWRAWSPAS